MSSSKPFSSSSSACAEDDVSEGANAASARCTRDHTKSGYGKETRVEEEDDDLPFLLPLLIALLGREDDEDDADEDDARADPPDPDTRDEVDMRDEAG